MITLFRYLKRYRLSIVFVFILTLVSALLELYLPTLMADVVDVGIVQSDIPYILQMGGWMIAFSVLAVLLTITRIYLSSRVALSFSRDVRSKLFRQVEQFSLEEYNRIGAASLITRTTNDVKQVQDVLNMMLNMMARAPFMLLGGIIMAVSRDKVLSLIFFAILPVLVLLIFLISRKAIPLFGALQKKTDRLNLLLRETLSGVRVIRAFNRVEDEKERFNRANEDYRDTGIAVNRLMAFLFPMMLIVMNFTNIAIIWFGGVRIDHGMMQVGNLMAFLQYALMILMSMIMLSMTLIMIPRAQASARRINEVLSLESKLHDPKSPVGDTEVYGHIEFRDVTFRYQGAEKPAIEQVSFRAKPGEVTAIIGSTGAGKTSLVQLIPRFYDVEKGAVLVNGIDVRQMSQKQLRQKIGYVPQKALLFSGSIADNLRLGKENATEEEIRSALRTAQALEFVLEKENGIHTRIEQGGSNLSGGQKQRLSIARALIRKPEIYIFDDSFSALDYKTDAKLRKALRENITNSTVIIVAQRVSTVIDADQIIVLDDGRVAGIGTHETLLKSNTVYQEIVSSQQAKEESA